MFKHKIYHFFSEHGVVLVTMESYLAGACTRRLHEEAKGGAKGSHHGMTQFLETFFEVN